MIFFRQRTNEIGTKFGDDRKIEKRRRAGFQKKFELQKKQLQKNPEIFQDFFYKELNMDLRLVCL